MVNVARIGVSHVVGELVVGRHIIIIIMLWMVVGMMRRKRSV